MGMRWADLDPRSTSHKHGQCPRDVIQPRSPLHLRGHPPSLTSHCHINLSSWHWGSGLKFLSISHKEGKKDGYLHRNLHRGLNSGLHGCRAV
jgi:hypothetical protein